MVFSTAKALVAAALLACATLSPVAASVTPEGAVILDSATRSRTNDPLCSLPTPSLVAAASQYPNLTIALNEVLQHPIATWYTDGESAETSQGKLDKLMTRCGPDTRMTIVVYGMPNKDCEAGYSNNGLNKNASDYRNWIQTLADTVGDRKVLYVLEPDAVGLVANGNCAVTYNYTDNVRMALSILSENENADIYMDVGFWTIESPEGASRMANTVKTFTTVGRLKGIVLNTSNYRPTADMADLCTKFQTAYGSSDLNCVVDTSRNFNNSPPDREWCNVGYGGIGQLPTASSGFSNIDYLIWIKPAGESDGTCDDGSHTANSLVGPSAGTFFTEHFVALWNNGYFVQELGFEPVSV